MAFATSKETYDALTADNVRLAQEIQQLTRQVKAEQVYQLRRETEAIGAVQKRDRKIEAITRQRDDLVGILHDATFHEGCKACGVRGGTPYLPYFDIVDLHKTLRSYR